jgi:RNA recognition motif-containing protein
LKPDSREQFREAAATLRPSEDKMNTKLYVGNLSFDTTENDLQDLFQQHGPVSEVNLITDRMSGRSRGFAFVTMATPEGAQAAVQALSGKELQGRALTVNEARPREDSAPTRGGGGGGGGGQRRQFSRR